MNPSQSLNALKQQIQSNFNAFKKNKENSSLRSNFIKPLRSNADLQQIKSSVNQNINSLIITKKQSSQTYESLVKQLKLLLQQAWTKNQFLVRDRAEILKENFLLKENIENLSKNLEEAKQVISDLKLNGCSGHQVNGMFENGDIFKIGHDQNSRLVSEKDNYSIGDRQSMNITGLRANQKSMNSSLLLGQNRHKYSPSSSQNPNEESMLMRQVSAQFLKNSNANMSPAPQSYPSSDINQTPNYNFREDFSEKINPAKDHFVEVGSEFISEDNSRNNSNKSQHFHQGNQEAEISMNNITNDLYLPINKDKPCLKQEIQTFKEHLYLVNNSCQHSAPYKKQNPDFKNSSRPQEYEQNQSPSQNQNTEFIYCSSTCEEGIFRAFYLSIIKYPIFREKFFENLQELEHDDTFALFPLYPKNGFWISVIASFLEFIDMQKPTHEDVLKHINTHKLIDLLFIQALKYRVQWLYNDCPEDLNESSLLNGSINCSQNFNSHTMTNRESINASFQQQSPQEECKFLEFFTALSNLFGLECKKDERAFYFYESQCEGNLGNSEVNRPIFVIVNIEQINAFGFDFSLYFEKSQIQGSRVNMNNSQRQISQNQMNQFSNSVKKNFKDIQINEPQSHEKNSQNSNLLKSYDNSSNGKYMEERSFISQTNEYEDEPSDEYEDSQQISCGNDSQALPYVANTNLHRFNCTTRNIPEMLMSSSNDNTLRSLRVSNEGIFEVNSERGKQLKERQIPYNMTSFNYPIREELIETESKEQLYTSFGKLGNLSNMSSLLGSPHVSGNASKILNDKKDIISVSNNKVKNTVNKGNKRYGKEEVHDENFILKQVKSCQSQESEGVINGYEDEYEEEVEDWKPLNLKLR